MNRDGELAVLAAARAMTGVIRALDLHADITPDRARFLRTSADDLRTTRDGMLAAAGLTIEEAKASDYGASREWTGALQPLSSTFWPYECSRDAWAPRS